MSSPQTNDSLTGCWKETLKLESVSGHTSNCSRPALSGEKNNKDGTLAKKDFNTPDTHTYKEKKTVYMMLIDQIQ